MGFTIRFGEGEYKRGERRSFEVIPPGTYSAVLDMVEFVPPNVDNGSVYPYLNATYIITDGDFENRKVWRVYSFSPAAVDFFMDLLDGIGLDPALLAEFSMVDHPDVDGAFIDVDTGLIWGDVDSPKGNATVVAFEMADGSEFDLAGLQGELKVVIDKKNKDRNQVDMFIADGVTLSEQEDVPAKTSTTSKTNRASTATRSTSSRRKKKVRR